MRWCVTRLNGEAMNPETTSPAGGEVRSRGGRLFDAIDPITLAIFRILFGLFVALDVLWYFRDNHIARLYMAPPFLVHYEWLPFLRPFSLPFMHVVFAIQGVSALALALGLRYRLAAATLLVSYGYIFLLDRSYYNNHYYLICLLTFLFLLVRADTALAIDAGRRVRISVPFWHLAVFRAQIVIVYFYGGLAKLNADWLRGEPVRFWLSGGHYPDHGAFLAGEPVVYFMAYGGLIFDLLVGFMLMWRPTRVLAIALCFFFHISNKLLFDIAIFPYLMLATLVLFIDPARVRRLVAPSRTPDMAMPARPSRAVVAILVVYVCLQLLVPFRHLVYPGNANWTEEGQLFAWRMMLRHKHARLSVWISDPATGRRQRVDLRRDLPPRQMKLVTSDPAALQQYAAFLRKRAQRAGVASPVITARALVALNGRPYQNLVDPSLDLARLEPRLLGAKHWVIPLRY